MFVSIDIGGTNTRIGFSKDLKTFTKIKKFPTPKGLNKLQEMLLKNLTPDVKLISLGVAGPIDHYKNKLTEGINIPALKGGITAQKLLTGVKTPIYLGNDAELAALAEAHFGGGVGYKTVAYITLSTGVGGALVINGDLPNTRFNPEPGHHIIEIGGRTESGTGIEGTFESLCGGIAFKEIYGIAPEECDDNKVWESYAEDLAVGLHNIILLWSPDIVILGGGLTNKAKYFLKPAKDNLTNLLKTLRKPPKVEISTLGDRNVLLGGLIRIKKG